MKTTHLSYLLLLPLLLSACGLYSNYEKRQVEFNQEHICATDTTAPPLSVKPWREMFTDSCLREWINCALTSNTDLRIAQHRVQQAEVTLKASKLAFLPSLDLKAEASTGYKTSSRFQIGPSASWEIDIFGRQRNLKAGAEAGFYASQAYRQAVMTSLIASVADSYYTLLMLDEQLEISERTIKTWDENIRVLQALKRAGRTNEAAVLQARANRMKVENSALTLKSQISAQENAMRAFMLKPDADLTRGKFSQQQFSDSIVTGFTLAALSNRPDVREAEFEVQKAFYNINVARSAFYPSLILTGNAGWTTSSGATIANPASWIANALGSLAAPLFNRGTNQANLAIAREEYEIASLKFQQLLLDAGMEVNNAITEWQTAHSRLITDKKQIVALQGAVHNTRLLMRNTSTNYLEVLTAQQRLLEAELTEAADRYDAIQALIKLYHALGGGVL